jgi:hypothetical protein
MIVYIIALVLLILFIIFLCKGCNHNEKFKKCKSNNEDQQNAYFGPTPPDWKACEVNCGAEYQNCVIAGGTESSCAEEYDPCLYFCGGKLLNYQQQN